MATIVITLTLAGVTPTSTLRRLGLTAVALLVASCGAAEQGDGPVVVVGVYPYAWVAERVAGEGVTVTTLVGPGAEPHDAELTPRQVAALGGADLVVRSAGLQPALDAVVDRAGAADLDVLTVVEPLLGPDGTTPDPHVWLDPVRLAQVADVVADRLADADPDGADGYRSRAGALRADLTALDSDLRTGLADCDRRQMVTSHAAYGYLAAAYDLEQVAISGLSPVDDPSPARLAELATRARTDGVTTVFFEELASPKVAEALAAEVGATAQVLNPIETEPAEGDYLDAMRTDLAALQAALGCR